MSEAGTREALRAAAAEVLETMFFESLLEEGEEPMPGSGAVRDACLTFGSQPAGEMHLRASEEAARTLAASFLAEDESELPEAKIDEALRELTNMICGAVLSRLDPKGNFQLSAPQLLPSESSDLTTWGVVESLALMSGTVTVGLKLYDK